MMLSVSYFTEKHVARALSLCWASAFLKVGKFIWMLPLCICDYFVLPALNDPEVISLRNNNTLFSPVASVQMKHNKTYCRCDLYAYVCVFSLH